MNLVQDLFAVPGGNCFIDSQACSHHSAVGTSLAKTTFAGDTSHESQVVKRAILAQRGV